MASVTSIIQKITSQVLNPLIVLLFAVAVFFFVWGIINYVIGSRGDEGKLKQGKQIMLWGLIGMFVMASAGGLVNLLCDFFGTCVSNLPTR